MIFRILLIFLFAELSSGNKFCQRDLCENGTEHLLCKDNGKIQYNTCPPRATSLVKLSTKYIEMILRAHNNYRNMVALGRVGILPMAARMAVLQWDTDLAKVAEVAVRQCQFEPLKCASTVNYPTTGQNEALEKYYCETSIASLIQNQIYYWLSHSDITSPKDLVDPRNANKNISYFLQTVRDRSDRIGCAAIRYILPNVVHLLFRCVYSCGISMCSKRNPVYETAVRNSGEKCRKGISVYFNGLCSEKENMEKCSYRKPTEKPNKIRIRETTIENGPKMDHSDFGLPPFGPAEEIYEIPSKENTNSVPINKPRTNA